VNFCVAVKGKAGKYEAFIEACPNYFGVGFLDGQGRVYLSYGFQDAGDGRLFLSQAHAGDFSSDDDHRPSMVTSHYFKKTGATTIVRGIKALNRREAIDADWDVKANWDVRRAFGDYEHLLVKDRGTAVLDQAGKPHTMS
jgi:hypothetical protein